MHGSTGHQPMTRTGERSTRGERPQLPASGRRIPSLLLLLLAIVVLLMVSALLLMRYARAGGDRTHTQKLRGEDPGMRGFTIREALAEQYYPLNEETVIRVGGDYVTYYDIEGNGVRSYRVYLTAPQVVQRGERALVYDGEERRYYLFDARGLVLYDDVEMRIESAILHDDGAFALLMQDAASRGVLRSMGPDGTHRFDRSFYDLESSGFLLRPAFTPDGKSLDVALVNTDGPSADALMLRLDVLNGSEQARYRLEDTGALPLLYHDPEGNAYLGDGPRWWQISEYGSAPWLMRDDVREVRATTQGLWVRCHQDDALYYYTWTAAGREAGGAKIVQLAPADAVGLAVANDVLYYQNENGDLIRRTEDTTDNLGHISERVLRIRPLDDTFVTVVTTRRVLRVRL